MARALERRKNDAQREAQETLRELEHVSWVGLYPDLAFLAQPEELPERPGSVHTPLFESAWDPTAICC